MYSCSGGQSSLLTHLPLNSNKSRTLSFENRKNIARVALSPDSNTLISIDEGERPSALLAACDGN